MVVFTLDKWTLCGGIAGVCFAILNGIIHGTEDFCVGTVAQCALILHGTSLIPLLNPVESSGEIRAVGRFVTQAPHDDGGVIVQHFHVMLVALQYLSGKLFFLSLGRFSVSEGVSLLICLGGYVQTVLIAQVIPARIIGIMACSDGVDVQAFHDFYILNHACRGDYIAAVGVNFMPVGAFNQYGFAVDKQLRVLDFNLSEAHFLGYYLDDVSLTVLDGGQKRIEIRCFGRPRLDVSQGEMRHTVVQFTKVSHRLYDGIAVGIQQLKLDDWVALYVHAYRQRAVLIVVLQVGRDAKVAHLHLWVAGIQVALAGHATETPEVLVLRERAVTPSKRLEGDEIAALMQVRGDIKLGCNLRIFGVTDVVSVHKEVHVRRDRAEVGDDLAAVPRRRNVDCAAI